MISPIGSFITQFDAAVTQGMTAGVTGLTAYLAKPVQTSAAIYLAAYGVRVANGDADVSRFVTRLVRIVVVLWLCSNAAAYNQWIINIFYTGLPAALNKAVLTNQFGAGGGANVAGGVQGTAAIFDNLWSQSDVLVGQILQQAPLLDVGSRVAAYVYGAAGGLTLVVIAMVYMMARFILAIVLELGAIAVGCLMFDATTPIFERWMGKVIALVFLQVTAVVVLQIVLTIDQNFVKQIVAAGGQVADQIQALMSMVVLFFMGAFAVYSLPAIAYSIGTGVAIQTMAPMMLAMRGAMGMAGSMAGVSLPAAGAGGAAGEGLSMGLADAELGSGGSSELIAPDPGSLPPPPVSTAPGS